MSEQSRKPRWAPRVPQHKIRRLYEFDAQGIIDEDLIADVGFRLYERCRSILVVRDISLYHRLPCPHCEVQIQLPADFFDQSDATIHCGACTWHMPWRTYAATFRHQELGAGGAAELFLTFVEAWERSASARERMLLIDRLIHGWHWQLAKQRPRFGLGRPTGVNLIEGNRTGVLEFLNALTYGPQSSEGTQDTKAAWRKHWDEVRLQQAKGKRRQRGGGNH